MGKNFDDLSKAIAGKVSRGQALRTMIGGAFAAAIAAMVPGKSFADPTSHSKDCARFCQYVYGKSAVEAGQCKQEAANGYGPCYYYGPASPACQNVTCPNGTFCTSVSMNNSLYGEAYCQPAGTNW